MLRRSCEVLPLRPLLLGVLAVACSGCSATDDRQWADADLSINELMSRNETTVADDYGEYDDWVEIYNGADEPIDLGGCFVSDKADDREKATLPPGLVVPAGGVLLLWADGDADQGEDHLPFRLRQAGEAFFLSTPTGTELDGVEFGVLLEDEALARHPDGTGAPAACLNPTPGELNGASCD